MMIITFQDEIEDVVDDKSVGKVDEDAVGEICGGDTLGGEDGGVGDTPGEILL